MKFRIGDRVIINIRGYYGISDLGSTGVITDFHRGSVEIMFDHLTGLNNSVRSPHKFGGILVSHLDLISKKEVKSHLPDFL